MENSTCYQGLRDPHWKMPTDSEHTARKEVGGSTDDSHTGQCYNKELHPAIWHVHLHQHRGHHKHHQDHKERRNNPHIWRQPINTTHTQIDVLALGKSLSKVSWPA